MVRSPPYASQSGRGAQPNLQLEAASGVAPVQKMLEMGLNVGIGTDGPASNNDMDMFEEVRLAPCWLKVSAETQLCCRLRWRYQWGPV